MVKTTGKKSYIKTSSAKTLGKPPFQDKTPGIEPVISFYELEDIDNNEEGE